MKIDGFEWDDGNTTKCRKHGVSIAEIEDIFLSGRARVWPDRLHSEVETRFQAIGVTAAGRHVFVVFTLRGNDQLRRLRPISARFMHRKEIDRYEEDASNAEDR